METNLLVARTEIKVRFCEVDAMGIVWHGNYLKFFEDGRDAFGKEFDLDFVELYSSQGYLTPLVTANCDYKRPLRLQEKAIVETTFVPTEAAKIIFDYKIYRDTSNGRELLTTGKTIQVFLKDGELSITNPDCYQQWKEKWLYKKG